jgi:ribonuclease HI
MEIMAAIIGLEALIARSQVTVYSDSQLLVNTMEQNWARKTNVDLWARLDDLCKVHDVKFEWIKRLSHDGNSRCDEIANFNVNKYPTLIDASFELQSGQHMPVESIVKADLPVLHVYTEAFCLGYGGYKGHGGYGVWIRGAKGDGIKLRGGALDVSFNVLGIAAIVDALKVLSDVKSVCHVIIYSRNDYILNIANGNWKASKNKEWWLKLNALRKASKHRIHFERWDIFNACEASSQGCLSEAVLGLKNAEQKGLNTIE